MKKKDKFYAFQSQIIDNLETLRINLENCEELGMIDLDEILYNEIVDLIDEAKAVDTIEELTDIIFKAKIIETKIDSWYSKQGLTNTELIWPQI